MNHTSRALLISANGQVGGDLLALHRDDAKRELVAAELRFDAFRSITACLPETLVDLRRMQATHPLC